MEPWEAFRALFSGSTSAYGEWDVNRVPPALTRHVGPTEVQYKLHLEGKLGLGIVPVNDKGVSYFGAIDIDIDTISHAALFKAVTELGAPLSVCRSKSGGAHLYAFFGEKGLPATQVQALLKNWASLLGYPQVEIFPKQRRVSPENHGNWINLPYYAGPVTTRYAVGPDGSLSLDQFLGTVKPYDAGTISLKAADKQAQLPPCLKSLTENGIGSGQRNQALFNLAVFYRKSSPADWESKARSHNSQFFQPPLDSKEVSGVIGSAGRASYQYTCDQPPLNSVCDRATCLTLPFGVGGGTGNMQEGFDALSVTSCRKLCTTPPRYIVDVNGRDVTLTWDELFSFIKFRSKVGEVTDTVVTGMKQPRWEQEVKALLANKVDIETPDDASMIGLVINKLHEFLVLRERASEKEDLLRGLPVQEGQSVLFRVSDFKHYLQGYKLDKVELNDIWLVIQRHGAKHRRVRLNGRQVTVWTYPVDQIQEQQQDFKVPDFKADMEEV